MLDRFGIDQRDRRNLLIVATAVGLITAVLTDASLLARFVVGIVAGVVSAVSFLVVTILLYTYSPYY